MLEREGGENSRAAVLGLLLLRLFVPEAGFVGGPAGVVPGFDEEATRGRRIMLARFVRVRGGISFSLSRPVSARSTHLRLGLRYLLPPKITLNNNNEILEGGDRNREGDE